MKKFYAFGLMLFLTACLQAPQDVFNTQLNLGTPENLPVAQVETVSLQKEFDSAHHIEKKWPKAPQEIIQKWADEKLKPDFTTQDRFIVVIHHVQVVRAPLPNPKWYQNDEMKDTLSYQVEFVFKSGEKVKYRYMVQGKAFSQMPAKASLADQEKEWVQMANQMLNSLQTELIKSLKNVV